MPNARDVFNRAVALLDEVDAKTGGAFNATTVDYEARAPFIINLLQDDLVRVSGFSKRVDVSIDTATENAVTLPDDCEEAIATEVLTGGPANQLRIVSGMVYPGGQFEGSLRIYYRPILVVVRSLSDEVVDDTQIITALSWGLARTLVANEGNDALELFFSREYERHRAGLQQKKIVLKTSVDDVYNFWG